MMMASGLVGAVSRLPTLKHPAHSRATLGHLDCQNLPPYFPQGKLSQ